MVTFVRPVSKALPDPFQVQVSIAFLYDLIEYFCYCHLLGQNKSIKIVEILKHFDVLVDFCLNIFGSDDISRIGIDAKFD